MRRACTRPLVLQKLTRTAKWSPLQLALQQDLVPEVINKPRVPVIDLPGTPEGLLAEPGTGENTTTSQRASRTSVYYQH